MVRQMGDLAREQEEAFRRVLAHRTMLKAYVQAIVRDPALAEDTFSDVTLEIARSWERFDVTRAFEPWARGVARRVALANLRKQNRPLVTLDEKLLESIGAELDRLGSEAEHEVAKGALERCVAKLSAANQALVRLRYFDNLSYEEISRAVGRGTGALYVAFNRIHQSLGRCVRRELGRA
jgi:RNA polymerase sigma-70 factor (ECF subfamily)